MELSTRVIPALTKITANDDGLTIPAGQRLRIETSPGGAEILDAIVPAGKRWINLAVSISGDEVDA